MTLRAIWTVPVAALLIGVYFLGAWEYINRNAAWVSFDTYQYFYPNMVYAARGLAAGGQGLLWNAMQACGTPFFGISSTGTLYPLHWLFYLLDADLALRAVLVLNLAIAGVGAYLLCREVGVGRLGAACGVMCFELGNSTLDLTSWQPMVAEPYVWLPMVMFCCERVLRGPTPWRAVALGASLAVAILGGFPQIVLFTCELIALRFVWEIATRRGARPVAGMMALGAGVVLALLLAAVLILPVTQTARESVRGLPLTRAEILAEPNVFEWDYFRRSLDARREIFNPFIVLPAVIGAAALVGSLHRRRALFYAAAGALFFALSFGEATPLFDLYLDLPFGMMFREPARFLWVPSFCLAVVCALGFEALLGPRRQVGTGMRLGGLAAAVLASIGLSTLAPSGLRPVEWVSLFIVAAAVAVAVAFPGRLARARLVVAATLAFNLAAFPLSRGLAELSTRPVPRRHLISDGAAYRRNAAMFEAVRARMTAQDRAYLIHAHPGVAFAPKSGQIFGIPVVQDYEPQPTLRFAQYLVFMRRGREMARAMEYYSTLAVTISGSFQRRLLDLAAARFVLAERAVDTTRAVIRPPLRFARPGAIRVYENNLALARARFVPRVEVLDDPSALLRRLAYGSDDLRKVALIEEPLASGFTGSPEGAGQPRGASATGRVEFRQNDPEHVVLDVQASERGFLHLADQYAAGWSATVNGSPVPIARANFLFRLVEVPAGASAVEFRYTPPGLGLGALISGSTVAGLLVFALVSRRRAGGRRSAPADEGERPVAIAQLGTRA